MMRDKLNRAFDEIHADEQLKAHTRAILAAKRAQKQRISRPRRLVAAMACFVCLLLGLGGYQAYFTPTSAISLDVNPSLELGINRFDKVISVQGLNDDGQALSEQLHVRFLNYMDALNQILADSSMQAYLSDDAVLSIVVVGDDTPQRSQILADVQTCTAGHNNVHCSAGNAEEVAAAHEVGLSFGKYQAFLELQALDPSVTPEDVQQMTMREIRDRIAALSGSDTTTNGNGNGNNGNNGNASSGGNDMSNGNHAASSGNDNNAGNGHGNAGAGHHNGYGGHS